MFLFLRKINTRMAQDNKGTYYYVFFIFYHGAIGEKL